MSKSVMVTVKNSDAVNVYNGLQNLSSVEGITYTMKFRAGIIMHKLREQLDFYESERLKLFEKFGVSKMVKQDGKEEKEEVKELNEEGQKVLRELLKSTGEPVPSFSISEFVDAAEKNSKQLGGLTTAMIASIAPILILDADL